MSYEYIENNLLKVRRKIESACKRSGRDSSSVYLVAVSKTFPVEAMASALDFNQLDFGENRVQELVNKHSALNDRIINWHLVGQLQKNKVKYVVPFIFLVHSVDSFELALRINKEAEKINRTIRILLQVNVSGEEQKSGCEPKLALTLAGQISKLSNVKLKGLMTIARIIPDKPSASDKEIVRGNFRTLNSLFEEIKAAGINNVDMKYLSMGMTSDFEIAIEEGSNMIRIGSAIFGNR